GRTGMAASGSAYRTARLQRFRQSRDDAGCGRWRMSAAVQPAVAAEAGGIPYVGLRPYGPEERDLFFGRDSDSPFLQDKILSARVTLLYAPSGIGKSSL